MKSILLLDENPTPSTLIQRTMWDSINPFALPVDADVVAGYIDGKYKWSAAGWSRFSPRTVRVRIAVFATTNDGDVLDIEKGDATPAESSTWVKMRQSSGLLVPSLYFSLGDRVAVANANVGLTYDEWIADWGGQYPHIPVGAAACQWGAFGTYDKSLCQSWWPR
jgi:hypothetical protein